MNHRPDETFFARIGAYLRFERSRARTAPVMLLLAFVGLGSIVSGRLGNNVVAVRWPFWVAGGICIAIMVAIVAFQDPRES